MPKAQNALGLKAVENTDDMTVTIMVYDFDEETSLDETVFSFRKVHATLQARTSLYGLKKILMDRTSQVKENPEAKLAAMADVMARLETGEWSAERQGGGLGVVSVEVQALAQVKGITVPDAQLALKSYTKEQREKILSSAKVQEAAKALRAQREKAEVKSLDDML